MKRLIWLLLALLLVAFPCFAAQPTTIYDNTTTYPATVDASGNLHINCQSGCSAGTAATHAQSSALASNLVIKASAGTLYTFNAVADSTLNAAAWYVLIFDATSLPANGAVTPAKCYEGAPGQTTLGGNFGAGGTSFTTGITIGVSTTGCFSLTASVHAALMGDYQ